jgi:hypothetical protein
MLLIDLPFPILREIYRCLYSSQNPHLENNSKPWRNFLSIANKSFSQYRKEWIYLPMNPIHTLLFQKNEEFRQKVLSRIIHKEKQLGFYLHEVRSGFSSSLSSSSSSSPTPVNFSVDLVDELNKFQHFNNSFHVKLWNLSISNVITLSSVYLVEIIDCPYITDLSGLKNIYRLLLCNCEGITDISVLCNISDLSLYRCHNIRHGYNSLKNVKKLCINDDHLVKISEGGEGLNDITELFLTCSALNDIKTLSNKKSLTKISFSFCESLIDIISLYNVAEVSFTYCDNIRNVDCLTNVKKLAITSCNKITSINLNELNNLQDLHIGFCALKELILPSSCSFLQNVSISNCNNLTKIEIFLNLKNISVYGCSILKDIISLNSIYRLVINYNENNGPRVNIKGIVHRMIFNPIIVRPFH